MSKKTLAGLDNTGENINAKWRRETLRYFFFFFYPLLPFHSPCQQTRLTQIWLPCNARFSTSLYHTKTLRCLYECFLLFIFIVFLFRSFFDYHSFLSPENLHSSELYTQRPILVHVRVLLIQFFGSRSFPLSLARLMNRTFSVTAANKLTVEKKSLFFIQT